LTQIGAVSNLETTSFVLLCSSFEEASEDTVFFQLLSNLEDVKCFTQRNEKYSLSEWLQSNICCCQINCSDN